MKKVLLLVVAVLTMMSCDEKKKKEASDKPEIKMYALQGGSILVKRLQVFSQDTTYTGQSKQFADAYYVIVHPKGTLMWDAGLPEQFVLPKPYNEPSGTYAIQRPDSLENQLASIGLKVSDFTHFAMSHSHFDHIGHAGHMKDAMWLVQESEYNSVRGPQVRKVDPGLAQLNNVQKLNGDYDVFGDGTVMIKSMPGHTVGHQVLYVDLGLEQPILLTGDLYHFDENREKRRMPTFNYSVEQTLESMDKFEAFAKEKNANVFIQHSPADFERIKKYINQK
jgi:glyoxylase-like metal-dependent hydrolase (beta-lactamase superfamily II)